MPGAEPCDSALTYCSKIGMVPEGHEAPINIFNDAWVLNRSNSPRRD